MPAEDFTPALRHFISCYVRSVEQLEILLLLRQQPDRVWSVQAVYDVILSTTSSIERWLTELTRSGFVCEEQPLAYRYSATGEPAEQIAALAHFYKTTPVQVIEAIYQPKADAAQSFADSFKLKNPNSP